MTPTEGKLRPSRPMLEILEEAYRRIPEIVARDHGRLEEAERLRRLRESSEQQSQNKAPGPRKTAQSP